MDDLCRPSRRRRGSRRVRRPQDVKLSAPSDPIGSTGADKSLMVAQGLDQFALVHLRAAFDPDLAGPLDEVGLRPVLVAARLATLAAHGRPRRVRRRVGDTSGLLLARALATQRLVLL